MTYRKREMIAERIDVLYEKIYLSWNQTLFKIYQMSQNYMSWILSDEIYKAFRHLSYPWHWVIIWMWMISTKSYERILFDEEGFQIISGNTGSGKTSLTYAIIERDRMINSKPWYINSPFEKPREDLDRGIKYLYHKLYNFTDFWSNWKMHALPNHKRYGGIVIDEMHRELDYRMTMTREYKSKFNPFRDYAVVVRHYIKKIIATTQMERVDKQLMQLAKYFHVVRINIGFDYEDWLVETGAFRFKILGWYVDSYTINALSDTDKVLYKTWYYQNEYADFDYYDTYSMSGAYDHLPLAR